MPKVKISEYSATANSNTDVASINIDEGCAPSGINNAIRAIMGHLKDFQQGTNGDPFNGPHNGTVGATTPSTGAFTTLSATGNVTLGDASTDTLNVGNGGLIKDASGNVGIGVASPSYPLDVKLANNQFILARESTSNITNGFRIAGSGNEAKAVFSASSATGEVNVGAINTNYFLTFSTNGANERMRIPAAGGVQAVTTISVGNATPSSSGAGITFPATDSPSSNANTLDDYEEGTWPPGLTSSGSPLSATISSAGRYTKIGNSVFIWGSIYVSAISSATGTYLRITGLPFSFATSAGAGLEGLPSGSFGPYASFTGLSASDNLIVGASSTTELNIWIASGNGSFGTGASGANLQVGTNFYFSIVGKVA